MIFLQTPTELNLKGNNYPQFFNSFADSFLDDFEEFSEKSVSLNANNLISHDDSKLIM